MQLAKIIHYQCGDFNGITYIMIPEDMSQETFEDKVETVQTKYMAYEKEWNETERVFYVQHLPSYHTYPKNLTIEQIDAQHAEELAKYNEWEKKERKSKWTFAKFLAEEGFMQLWEDETGISMELNWVPKDFSLVDTEDEDDY